MQFQLRCGSDSDPSGPAVCPLPGRRPAQKMRAGATRAPPFKSSDSESRNLWEGGREGGREGQTAAGWPFAGRPAGRLSERDSHNRAVTPSPLKRRRARRRIRVARPGRRNGVGRPWLKTRRPGAPPPETALTRIIRAVAGSDAGPAGARSGEVGRSVRGQ